ncbi:Mitochondrial distribution and morphology protein 12 [Recurvomyces mirabilis]|uniref:1-phosphatidylinositol-3-phosphate 5-kinase n=1 Tax=Recurvomyces mirabilis TaxID=574656 RepID=A0AAE0WN95_9PEZI|nr:Mitochondrial distribution and morphology protein 12 [Recurvomyces mirabilis]KAK5157809.1 Mitochondrial distribution and morphology protein 12 [Recurvomyces mirabilis]
MAKEPPSPSASSTLLPFLGPGRSRRGSLASINSRKEIDKDVLAQALDHIHTSASKSEQLTSFHDFDGGARIGAKELVSNGVSGLYNRLKQSVGGGSPSKDGKVRPKSSSSKDAVETGSAHSSVSTSRTTPALTLKRPVPDSASVSTTSAAASPIITNFSSAVPVLDVAKPLPTSLKATAVDNGANADEQPDIAVNDYEYQQHSTNDVSHLPTQSNEISEEDVEQARHALLDDDRSESATQALARVLSHHDVQANEPHGTGLARSTTRQGQPLGHLITPSAPHADGSSEHMDRASISTPENDPGSRRPPMLHVGASHLPGFKASRASSTTDGGDLVSSSSTPTNSSRPALDPSPNLNSAMQRRRTGLKPPPGAADHTGHRTAHVPHHLKRRVISKEFWMKDENARDCFYCGQSFSTFRRKHHCRTCGQIFDARCTSLVSGRPFGQPGTLRLCRPCEAMIYESDDDDSTVFSDDGDDAGRSPRLRSSVTFEDEQHPRFDGASFSRTDTGEVATPSIGIPVSRRNREAKRRSNVIEFDAHPALARPSSSHSLISLSRRPRSASHRRQNSRHQNVHRMRSSVDDRVPFQQDSIGDPEKKPALPAFHNDNIIDPDLAPFMSDEGSEDEDQPSIMAALEAGASPGERERLGFGGLFTSAIKKGRSKLGERTTAASSLRAVKDDEALGQASRHTPKPAKRRNPSISSMTLGRPSPRRSRSNMLLKTIETGVYDDGPATPAPDTAVQTKVLRSSAMQGCDAPPVEMNRASLEHVRRMLKQLLVDGKVGHATAWEKALLPILLQCSDDVEPDVQRGDDMDIRHYVKLKKVPGGKPGDTSYVSGVVFSKNVALKSMARSLRNPRIAIVTFSIEYARHQTHFMSLEPVIAQEREYLHNLVGRIAALKPHLLLVERNVSGLALRLLEQAGITVAFNIKESVLAAVARVTQTNMIKSVDKLAIDPSHLGKCESFEVKTYLSNGVRKTYIYLSGCQSDLGCTIVLRGGDTKALRQIKRITEFMCYVVYNLKLETTLMRDEFVSIPSTTQDKIEAHDGPLKITSPLSATLPSLIRAQSDTETPSRYEELEEWCRSRILSASPFVSFMQPYVLTQLREQEQRLATFKKLRDQYAEADEAGDEEKPEGDDRFALVRPEMVTAAASKDQPKAVREYLHAVHQAQFDKTMHTYETQKRLWESFMTGSITPFDPYSHQTIAVLHSTVSSITSAPCTGPEILGIGFYAGFNRAEPSFEEDCTLGQYVEDMCMSASSSCKECGKRMIEHHRQYVHGYGQLTVSVQRSSARLRGYNTTMLMWSSCRICRAETAVVPMSDNTWKYSFAKYLELSFWSSPLRPRAGVCEHDIHKDFLRCFGFQGMVVRVQYDPIDIYDVVVPRSQITWRVEADLTVKNEQFSHFLQRLTAFIDSVRKRLDSINVDTLDEKKAVEAYEKLQSLRERVDDDHTELLEKLQAKYSTSRYYELIPLNRALRFMDEKAIAWDDEFNRFETDYFPSETDIRKLATLQLRNMFLESQPSTSSISSDASDTEDNGDAVPRIRRRIEQRLEGTDLHSEKAHDLLASTALEHRTSQDVTNEVREANAEDLLGTNLARHVSPREEREQAADREDVRHLDLAVPAKSPDDTIAEELPGIDEQTKQTSPLDTCEGGPTAEPFAVPPKPLGSGLLERIEQIRSNRAAAGETNDLPETKIPRLADLRRRDISPQPSPPLLRAQSQPVHVPRRSADLTVENNIDALVAAPSPEPPSIEKRLGERLGVNRLASKVGKVVPSLIPRSIPQKQDEQHSSSVSALAKHFEQMSREFEKERLKERRQRALRSRQARANPVASSRPIVEVYRNATDAVGERSVDDLLKEQEQQHDDDATPLARNEPVFPAANASSSDDTHETPSVTESHEPTSSDESQAIASQDFTGNNHLGIDIDLSRARTVDTSELESGMSSSTLLSPTSVPDLDLHSDLSIPEHRKNVWFKYLADFWSKRSASGWANLEYPLHSTEHVFEDSDIIVREDEPSSVVALSLACADYLNKVQDFRSHPSKHVRKHVHTASQTSANIGDIEDEQQKAIKDSLLSDTGTHMKYSFAHGPVKASCKIFYAESFDALRRRCGVSERFVESMSRCLKYDSKGGKTKSLFLKTLDNRFIIKSLQEVELKAFTKFAPDYFAFMSATLFHGVPSVIAKMFGLFQVTIKNPATGMDFSYYLLVMENLFYERNPNRRFDLKGSMRNRKIESTGQPDEVLLDENLVETIFEQPLFVREHARKLMHASVFNDTLWLCKQNVMDYSLMAGFDDERKELVVGIIDCIRTYTWDKKLESWIKDRGKNRPTITSPKDYRNRFRVSMAQYVLQAPNCWHQFQAQMMAPKTLKEREEGREETEDTEAERYEGRRSDGL